WFRRQQQLRFDVNQRRSHHQKIARDGDVQLLHQLEISQVLLGDVRDRDVVDVDFVFSDQIEQQVEWPLKDFQLNAVGVTPGFVVTFGRAGQSGGRRSLMFVLVGLTFCHSINVRVVDRSGESTEKTE